jgi:3-phosphoshikimate 1-carboxyvinyltransferase
MDQGFISIPANLPLVEKGDLPPSKSHLIRWLLLASQGGQQVKIQGVSGAAKDACAMRDALIALGVVINIEEDTWTVHGVGSNGFKNPEDELNLHNSGTSLRLLSIAITRIGDWITINGDSTLDARIDRGFWTSLGVDVNYDSEVRNLPMKIKGPITMKKLPLNCEKTSQYLSAIILSMPSMKNAIELAIEGFIVSRRHALLSFTLARKCGSPNTIENPVLKPWKCKPPPQVDIPPDASHVSFWKLYDMVHGTKVQLPKVEVSDSIGAEFLPDLDLKQYQTIDLSEANDLITPLAAAMAIGGGGIISGASHARHKESNRIERTIEMLTKFSIDITQTSDGLIIVGNQQLSRPSSPISTFGDHRMQMTAVVLATKVGADIQGADLHEVSFPEFINLIQP